MNNIEGVLENIKGLLKNKFTFFGLRFVVGFG